MHKVAIILPSRGLMFSQTADEILQNVKGIPHKFYFAHRRPIPNCFEEPLQHALADKTITHVWFVEDDMVLPSDTLTKLLAVDKAVVTADYPVNKDGRGSVFSVKGRIIFSGTGCLLVKREVFDELSEPYFSTDTRWNIKNYGTHLKMSASKQSNIGYGLHDVNFGMKLYQKDIPIHKIDTVLGQRKLIALGKAGSNNGAHNIETWTKVTKDHLLKEIKQWPIEPKGDLVTVITPTGEILTNKKHAAKLVKAGAGKRAPRKYLVVDWSK